MTNHLDNAEELPRSVTVWDLPVRIFHWLLVLLLCFQYLSFKVGGDWMTYHMWSGYAILTLLLFRVAWGCVGSTHARFADFIHGPRAVLAHLKSLPRREPASFVGHNPVGGWSVLLMLLAVLAQAATGLFANDDVATEGPLAGWVTKETSDFITTIHRYNFYFIAALAATHVAAILYYLYFKAENLTKSMITGRKMVPTGTAPPYIAGTGLALVILAVAGVLVYLLVRQWK
jgi:cytochrome b